MKKRLNGVSIDRKRVQVYIFATGINLGFVFLIEMFRLFLSVRYFFEG